MWRVIKFPDIVLLVNGIDCPPGCELRGRHGVRRVVGGAGESGEEAKGCGGVGEGEWG